MKFNTRNVGEKQQAVDYLHMLLAKDSLVEVKKLSPRRSLSQNNYLYLLLGAFGTHFGYSLEEAKFIYKEINADIYCYKKKNRTFWRSSAELTKEEMAQSIDKFMKKSAEADCQLPLATDEGWLREIENEMERSKFYLRG